MRKHPTRDERGAALSTLARLLGSTGLPTTELSEGAIDAELSLDGERRLRIEVNRLGALRMEDVRSRLALGLVRLWATAPTTPSGLPEPALVVVLLVPELTNGAVSVCRSFMTEHGRGAGWALLADSGEAVVEIPALRVAIDERLPRSDSQGPRRSIHLFSDLNRWMLKILTLGNVPESLWGGPRTEIRSVRHLAEAADVSVAAAQRFTRTFEEQGFLEADRDGLRVVRRADLMRTWLATEAGQPAPRAMARWIFGRPRQLEEIVGTSERSAQCVVGGFEACRRFHVLHVLEGLPVLHVHRVEPTLEAFDLEACDERDAHVVLVPDRHPESVERGAVVVDGLRVTDILQTALDVSTERARGREQVDHILRHVLGWELG